MNEIKTRRAWLIALRTPGLGPRGLRERLADVHDDIEAVLAQLWHQRAMLAPGASAWLRQPDEARLAADQEWLAVPGNRLLCCTDADFPPQLEHIPQPPAALFVVGDTGVLLHPQVAIVGARAASAGGIAHARVFAQQLAQAGFVLTSGLAEGIDAAAHSGTLDAGGLTVAVMGTGPDLVYPRKHQALAQRIAEHGALVTEFPPGTAARADHFPRRNRLIAGLSLGTLVVEAGLRSGSLITARLAGEQGREVFALPGSIHNPLARGCHRLIREGARLVEGTAEIVETLAPAARMLGGELALRLAALNLDETPAVSPEAITRPSAAPPGESGSSSKSHVVLRELGHDPVTLDELVARTGQSPAELGAQLLILELDAKVESLAGNRYQRSPPAGED